MTVDRAQFGNLDLGLLSALVALVEERSTVAAARRLNLAQSTVAGQLARLREALGDALLVREGRGLVPTPRALLLVERARPHLEALAAVVAAEVPFDPSHDARVFRFGCTDGVALAILPALTAQLRRDAPACDVMLRVGDFRSLPGMLQTGEVSTVLAFLRDGALAGAKQRVVRRSTWVVLRDAAMPPVVDVADYAARPHALVTPTGDLAGVVDEGLQAAGLQRRVAVGVTSFALLPAVLAGTDMLATVPDFVGQALKGLAVDACPVEVVPVTNTLAWRMVADDDPAERWFRAAVLAAFQVGG
jgi:LysR family transcriptional regulator, mexEF-oprN operon transcriptional activator